MPAPYWELTVPVSEQISEGLANLVWELGALGVVEDGVLRAFFPPDALPGLLESRVREYLDGLRALGFAVEPGQPALTALADHPWAEAWKAHFRPIEIGARFLVAPPWNLPTTSRLTIVIEPGRAFGTGHHGSTAGCLVLLERLCGEGALPPIASALDLGTGSGILGIAAARLGIADVVAIDSDPDAVAAAAANAARNGVSERVRCVAADADAAIGVFQRPGAPRLPPFPLVLANLLASAHVRLGGRYRELVAPGGALIVGGILAGEVDGVTESLRGSGFQVYDREILDGWVSLGLRPS